MAKRQIVAMGEAAFSVAGDDGVLDDYVLSLTRMGMNTYSDVRTSKGNE